MKKGVLVSAIFAIIILLSLSDVSAVMVSLGQRTLGVKDVWTLGWGFGIELKSIDTSVSPSKATVVLHKGGIALDEQTIDLVSVYNFYNYGSLIEVRLSTLHPSSPAECSFFVEFQEARMSSDITGVTSLPDVKPVHAPSEGWRITLRQGETQPIFVYYTITANAIDAHSQPQQAWITLKRNGLILDETVVQAGQFYNYTEQGSTIISLFVDSIFEGPTSGMAQFKNLSISSSIDVYDVQTAENWTCDEWSACVNDTQTRKCKDGNGCGTTFSKPAETQSCNAQCTEDWQCESWGSCINDIQERICKDINLCGTINNKPETKRACNTQCTEDWECGSWSSCSDGYQTRECKDKNDCGTSYDKPETKQVCDGQSCTENWKCKDWSSCENGIQKRVCKDINLCGTESGKPETKQECSSQASSSFIQDESVYIERKEGTTIIKVADNVIETSLDVIEGSSRVYAKVCDDKKEIKVLPADAVKSLNMENAEKLEIIDDACRAAYLVTGTKKGAVGKSQGKVDAESGKVIESKKAGQSSLQASLYPAILIISAVIVLAIIFYIFFLRKSHQESKAKNQKKPQEKDKGLN